MLRDERRGPAGTGLRAAANDRPGPRPRAKGAPDVPGTGADRHRHPPALHDRGRPPVRRGGVGAPRRPHHELPGRRGGLRAARTSSSPSRGRSTPPTSSPRSTSGARSARRSGSRRCARSSTGWPTPSPRGAVTAATSSTTPRPRPSGDELKHLLVTQKAAFNSPVWFNIGVTGVPAAGQRLLHPLRRRHDGLDPQLVPGGGHHLQGRLGLRREPVAHPLQSSSC